MMIKENSIIAVGAENSKPDYDYRNDVSLLAYELKENTKASSKVFDMNNEEKLSVEVLKNANKIIIESIGTDEKWTLVLKDVTNVESVEGAEFFLEENDTSVKVKYGNSKVLVTLK